MSAGKRAVDAIQIAAAQRAGPDLRAIITYETRMAAAARTLSMPS